MVTGLPQWGLMAVLAGAACGTGVFLLAVAIRGLPGGPGAAAGRTSLLARRRLRELAAPRTAAALAAGAVTLVATRWLVAAAGVALLVFAWRGLSGAAGERRALARLEALATWTESLRDTIAGAVGLEQAIPASLRVAAPVIKEPLSALVERLHIRVPMPDALLRFADDLDDPGADLIIAALVINARLRGPGLRDLLGSLSASVREELDMRRKVTAERRSIRRSVQIVVGVSVGMALALALLDHSFLAPYDGVSGQAVLAVVVGIYAAGIIWLRRLARFDTPQRLLTTVWQGAPAEAHAITGAAAIAGAAGNGGPPGTSQLAGRGGGP
ncbi:MAG TPA: type II secretion system F family protein [Streptosporangiaceae bacterium]|nr:type II secretion system F family protein [Streptosporangiaceae bacterium]